MLPWEIATHAVLSSSSTLFLQIQPRAELDDQTFLYQIYTYCTSTSFYSWFQDDLD